MSMLFIFPKPGDCEESSKIMSQLSHKTQLVITGCFQEVVKIATARRYHLIAFLTFDDAFPASWYVHELVTNHSPTMILTKVRESHIQLVNDWMQRMAPCPECAEEHSLFGESLKYIDQNLCETDLSLQTVSDHIFVSKYHYSRVFQKKTGVGFKEYIMSRRIETAKKLLIKGESVTSVCYSVGYNDLTHFSRIFKRLVGISPSTYRKTVFEPAPSLPMSIPSKAYTG